MTYEEKKGVLSLVRLALDAKLGSGYYDIIRKALMVGSDDPGEWAPNAVVIIHTEHGLPNGDQVDFWMEVSDNLDGYYCESINCAVVAVWPV